MDKRNKVDTSAIRKDVATLLSVDKSGHGMDHIDRVLTLAASFANDEGADSEIVTLATLLHDVDDYKIFGEDAAHNLSNARAILGKYHLSETTKERVLTIIHTMGYSKYLEGIRPNTLEGMVVSDADMCDAIGASGILRTHAYALSKGNEFFDKTLSPEIGVTEAGHYKAVKKTHSVQHFFDKLLKIPSILMTEAGKKEGVQRKAIMVSFLEELFKEEGSSVWQEYLRSFEESFNV